MDLRTRLESLDRRWLFLLMGVLVLLPLLFPLRLPIYPSTPVMQFRDAIARVPDGSLILMPCDYDPSGAPEMVPMNRTALRQLFSKHCRVVVLNLWNGGAGITDQVLRETAAEFPELRYGVDYVDLGYKAGNEAVMVLMGQGIANAFPTDYLGRDTRGMPLMQHVHDYTSFPLLVNISEGYPGTKEWVQQVQGRFHLPMVAGVTAVSAPEFYPYLETGQLQGLLGGMAGAAEYEKLQHEVGSATRGMDAQSLAHYLVAFCILAGNAIQWTKRRGTGS
ncbi:MAG: hypothetical protein ACHQ52_03605 [Candidatus Eisenbacteria bacterium]